MDMRLRMPGSMVDQNSAEEEDLHIPVTRGRNLLAGRNCSDKRRQDIFEVGVGRSTEFFVYVAGIEGICLLVCPASRNYVNYPKFVRNVRRGAASIESNYSSVFFSRQACAPSA